MLTKLSNKLNEFYRLRRREVVREISLLGETPLTLQKIP